MSFFKKYTRAQVYTLVAATLFLLGAIFMLVNTFADVSWAFWVGLGFAVVASGFYIFLVIENKKVVTKKLTDTKAPTQTAEPEQIQEQK